MRLSTLPLWAFTTAMLAAGAANACTAIQKRPLSPAERMREARLAVQEAAAIIDGEVIRPIQDQRPAVVAVSQVLKGPEVATFMVGQRTSCDLAVTRVGERLRLILVGGPGEYYAPFDYSNARYEDRLLRSDRRKVWRSREGSSLGPQIRQPANSHVR